MFLVFITTVNIILMMPLYKNDSLRIRFYIYGAITRTSAILSKERSLILIVIGLILQLAEAISAWKHLSMSPTIDFNFGTLLFSIGMFNLFLAINKKKS